MDDTLAAEPFLLDVARFRFLRAEAGCVAYTVVPVRGTDLTSTTVRREGSLGSTATKSKRLLPSFTSSVQIRSGYEARRYVPAMRWPVMGCVPTTVVVVVVVVGAEERSAEKGVRVRACMTV